ncbi:MAG: ATP-binding protein [Mariprofundaceae bacterium]|nr:ATP-binding protein [Mariprofundaceae bacterium]
MKRYICNDNSHNGGEYQALVATWMLRLLLTHNWVFNSFFNMKGGFKDEDVANFLNMPGVSYDVPISVPAIKAKMNQELSNLESQIDDDMVVLKNINLLARRVDLSPLQQEILLFALLVESSSLWGDFFRLISVETEQLFLRLLSCMLGVKVQDIKEALSKKSFLRQSGMITLDKRDYEDGKIGIMDELELALLAVNDNEEALLSHFLLQAKPSTLSLDDYPHANQDVEVIQNILKTASSTSELGVNILIYGTPGTGKTELVRLLAVSLGLDLFEVKTEDDEGDAMRPQCRLSSYRLSQRLLTQDHKSLIVFDEVEDIFPVSSFSFFGMEVKSDRNKGWMNKALEENETPAIWVCNQVSQIDPAFLRRFDYVMELNTPPKEVRLKIVRSYLENQSVSENFLERLAEHNNLSPAQIEKVSKVAARMGKDKKDIDHVLEKVVNNSLKAMGLKPLTKLDQHATHYDLKYLNANIDSPNLVNGLKRSAKGNICFYGAPGTGKTALAGYIAKALGKPLLSKRASDILGMYVGESEQNIAAMFEQAKCDNAVLVLDEADSLLRDRRGANQSWEVTQVNELLVQMENFDGLFICSTNLMDNLEQASLRRFAIKVKFDYLKVEQALAMLKKESIGEVSEQDYRNIQSMHYLAPGDFAAVKKRLDILSIEATASALIRELGEEMELKEDGQAKAFGFVAS